MNWNQVQERWQQFGGRMRSRWARTRNGHGIVGMRDLLIRELRARYDELKGEARKQLAFWSGKPEPVAQAKVEPEGGKVE